jgi:hypothetical protein
MSKRRSDLVPGQTNVIVFESYFPSAQRLTIRIDIHSSDRLKELEVLTRKLATGVAQQIFLCELQESHWVRPLRDIILDISSRDYQTRVDHRGEQLICIWQDTKDGWLEAAEKIGALIAVGNPGHQYFQGRHSNSVEIELAYLE